MFFPFGLVDRIFSLSTSTSTSTSSASSSSSSSSSSLSLLSFSLLLSSLLSNVVICTRGTTVVGSGGAGGSNAVQNRPRSYAFVVTETLYPYRYSKYEYGLSTLNTTAMESFKPLNVSVKGLLRKLMNQVKDEFRLVQSHQVACKDLDIHRSFNRSIAESIQNFQRGIAVYTRNSFEIQVKAIRTFSRFWLTSLDSYEVERRPVYRTLSKVSNIMKGRSYATIVLNLNLTDDLNLLDNQFKSLRKAFFEFNQNDRIPFTRLARFLKPLFDTKETLKSRPIYHAIQAIADLSKLDKDFPHNCWTCESLHDLSLIWFNAMDWKHWYEVLTAYADESGNTGPLSALMAQINFNIRELMEESDSVKQQSHINIQTFLKTL